MPSPQMRVTEFRVAVGSKPDNSPERRGSVPARGAGYWGRLSVLVSLAVLGGAAGPAWADTHYADAARADDSGDGLSWGAAKKTIQAAITDATSGDQVWVMKGTHGEALTLKSGVAVYGSFVGTEATPNDRAISANWTIVDGSTARGGLAAYHVVTMDTLTNARLDGFVVTGGNANGSRSLSENGPFRRVIPELTIS